MAYGEEEVVPPSNLYVGPYRSPTPSYTLQNYSLQEQKEPDQQLLQALSALNSPFLNAYYSSGKAFGAGERYTIFLPMDSSIIERLMDVKENASLGFSYKDRKYKTEAATQIENILLNHLVNTKIQPKQIEYRNTKIRSLNQSVINVNEQGEINNGASTILQYIDLPNASVFLISKEIV
jgi:uncharacterized surface protein with fasciclin (FAS1) repeats